MKSIDLEVSKLKHESIKYFFSFLYLLPVSAAARPVFLSKKIGAEKGYVKRVEQGSLQSLLFPATSLFVKRYQNR